MTLRKQSKKRVSLEILGLAIAVPLFFLLLITVIDKIAYEAERFTKEVPTYSITISEVEYNIPITVPHDFSSWSISLQGSSNPEYGIIQWTNMETSIRFSALAHVSSGDIKVAAFGIQGVDATNWWIWQEDGKVYEVDSETAKEYIKYLESLTSV